MTTDRLITADEFAYMLRRSRKTLNRLRAAQPAGFPPEYNFSLSTHPRGRRPMFKLSHVQAYIDAQESGI
ncbi:MULTISPECIES: helix-turn-helix transcriptional regulator [Sphingomonas]|uniref:helix-turn-helix transcriptional regulator n=1 Tax=Sphingomonas TaxID=13687 RepID=UPI000AB7091F|nr:MULTISPECIES: hypothetical protein [Sphingomonas]MDR6146164.1 hypothetical protein [Sphingomonas sp. SORGH_AS_0870]HJO65460.1 hypothetical protein [Sphingomonas sanguinis]